MSYEDINYNEITISGIINNITDTNNLYVKFGITSKKFTKSDNKNVYVSLNISSELYYTYLDYFFKGNKVFVKGYLNSYITKDNNIKNFITVTDISDNPDDILRGRKEPHIRYDPDGVMVWNGKRCEQELATEEEQQEMKF